MADQVLAIAAAPGPGNPGLGNCDLGLDLFGRISGPRSRTRRVCRNHVVAFSRKLRRHNIPRNNRKPVVSCRASSFVHLDADPATRPGSSSYSASSMSTLSSLTALSSRPICTEHRYDANTFWNSRNLPRTRNDR